MPRSHEASTLSTRVPYCKDGGKALMEDVREHTEDLINKNSRYKLQQGTLPNGPALVDGTKPFPKAKKLNDVKWSCALEKEAIKLLGDKCPETAPTAPADKTGLFYKYHDKEKFSYVVALLHWLVEIEKGPLSDAATKGDAVTYQGEEKVANFVNFIREDVSEIGCAQLHCDENSIVKDTAYCLLNKPPLKKGDVLYQKA
ncbi:hypothetical protein ANCCEY_07223 [Ancylostoma ceylanicum]|uniref:SCP domain-containing protein n=1 Tax=Ancylostoma ceylanicum TaxID=53326 RepID=A0A0D6LPA4_9BILA|nr:hypothetical protein ANCCEY_07223 [Ancylostoma ceylanicum]